jgi:uncharacterized membrane protein YdjX (TVP38/TMEM64 family)
MSASSVNDPDRGQSSATRRAGHPPEPQPRSARTVKLLVLLGIVAVLAVLELRLGVLADAGRLLSVARVEAWLDRAGVLAPVVYMLVMAVTVVTPLPTMPLDFLAGRFFGPVLGTLYSDLGATVGSLVSFQLARWFGRDLIARFFKGHILLCRQCSDRLMTKLVLLGRLVPVVSFDLISYSAGLTRMSAVKFAVASFLGMLPLTFVYNSAGHLVLSSRWIGWVGGGVMAALFFLLPVLIERNNLFSLRKYFTHEQVDEWGAEGRAR